MSLETDSTGVELRSAWWHSCSCGGPDCFQSYNGGGSGPEGPSCESELCSFCLGLSSLCISLGRWWGRNDTPSLGFLPGHDEELEGLIEWSWPD